jgi:hypothetical protein
MAARLGTEQHSPVLHSAPAFAAALSGARLSVGPQPATMKTKPIQHTANRHMASPLGRIATDSVQYPISSSYQDVAETSTIRIKECRMAAKTTCPVSREQFKASAKPIEVVIDGNKMIGAPREFTTGSLGWNISNKMTIMIDGKPVTVQVGLNLTIVGSKELPKSAEPEA